VNAAIRNAIYRRHVRCKHHAKGCQWNGVMGHDQRGVMQHLNTCEYEPPRCKLGCGRRIKEEERKKHEENECDRRRVECVDCGERIETRHLVQHQQPRLTSEYPFMCASYITCGFCFDDDGWHYRPHVLPLQTSSAHVSSCVKRTAAPCLLCRNPHRLIIDQHHEHYMRVLTGDGGGRASAEHVRAARMLTTRVCLNVARQNPSNHTLWPVNKGKHIRFQPYGDDPSDHPPPPPPSAMDGMTENRWRHFRDVPPKFRQTIRDMLPRANMLHQDDALRIARLFIRGKLEKDRQEQ